jgi:hypothetical protein
MREVLEPKRLDYIDYAMFAGTSPRVLLDRYLVSWFVSQGILYQGEYFQDYCKLKA